MKRQLILMAIAGALGCGRRVAPSNPAAGSDTSKAAAPAPVNATMPDPPPATSGSLRLVNNGPDDLAATVKARAGLCESPAVLMVQSTEQGIGALLVLALPAETDRVGRYPVTYSTVGQARLPTPPAAQLALQRITPRGSFGFQALEGTVELYGLGTKVSGRFQVSVRELNSDRIDRVAGSFADVPVERQPASYCRRLSDPAPPPQGPGR